MKLHFFTWLHTFNKSTDYDLIDLSNPRNKNDNSDLSKLGVFFFFVVDITLVMYKYNLLQT